MARRKRFALVKIVTVLIIIILLIALSSGLYLFYSKVLLPNRVYYDKVMTIDGNRLFLNKGKTVMLAGVYVPWKSELNYREEMKEYINELLLWKDAKIELVLKQGIVYPKFDLVNVYLSDNTLVNKKILEEGMGFFDQGYYRGKRFYEKIEAKAKEKGAGIWKDKQNLTILYVSSQDWWDFHYPECPEVKKIKPSRRIDYYFFPEPIFYYRTPADCKYCDEIEIKFHRPKLFTYSNEDWKRDTERERLEKAKRRLEKKAKGVASQ